MILWGRRVGAVASADNGFAEFQYDPAFVAGGLEVAPLTLPLVAGVYRFPELAYGTFQGLPGLLADSLPDRYGNALIDAWLASRGLTAQSMGPVERLCYAGSRAMGALEFVPSNGPEDTSDVLNVAELTEIARLALTQREQLAASLTDTERGRAVQQIMRVGTSAGGARPKAVIAWNRATGEIRSGQLPAQPGFEHWLLKFDVEDHGARGDETGSGLVGLGRVEHAYALMAQDAGINMAEHQLLEEGGHAHFMSKRFDRTANGEKLHMLTLCGIVHLDFNMPTTSTYEQAFQVIRQLGLGAGATSEMFRRAVFNILARNHDDHTKNTSFLMNRDGRWSLAPAYDLTYAYDPTGKWTSKHQMSLAGKRDAFTIDDLDKAASTAMLKQGQAKRILTTVTDAIARWPEHANTAGVPERTAKAIGNTHRRLT
ncbi:MAG TPA: type II toxin-antitoxin system HipA family toxin [Mycobacterium sp.]